MGSCHVAQADLKLLGSRDPPASASQSVGIIGSPRLGKRQAGHIGGVIVRRARCAPRDEEMKRALCIWRQRLRQSCRPTFGENGRGRVGTHRTVRSSGARLPRGTRDEGSGRAAS
ncbi:hypothetical protein AAY473_005617 [Plecturocebus cupreus]